MNLTTLATALNVKLTKPEMNLLAKLDEKYGTHVGGNPNEPMTVTNPYSGVTCTVNRLVGALITFTTRAYSTYNMAGTMSFAGVPVAIGTYDRVRYLVMKLDNKAYFDILD